MWTLLLSSSPLCHQWYHQQRITSTRSPTQRPARITAVCRCLSFQALCGDQLHALMSDRTQTLEKAPWLYSNQFAMLGHSICISHNLRQTSTAFHCIKTGNMQQVGNQTYLIPLVYLKKTIKRSTRPRQHVKSSVIENKSTPLWVLENTSSSHTIFRMTRLRDS